MSPDPLMAIADTPPRACERTEESAFLAVLILLLPRACSESGMCAPEGKAGGASSALGGSGGTGGVTGAGSDGNSTTPRAGTADVAISKVMAGA